MYKLKYDDLFADSMTNAYEPYEKECEVKILIDVPATEYKEKFNLNTLDCEIYMLVTLNKQYKNVTFIVTECNLPSGETLFLPSTYDAEERELIRKVALAKMRETMFKNF